MARLFTLPFALASLTMFFGAQVPNIFLLVPRFLAAEGYDEQHIGAIMGASNIAMLLTMPIWGRALARFGPKLPLVASSVLMSCGSLAFGGASGVVGYASARALQGFGYGGVLVGVSAFVAETAPRERLVQALGVAGVLTLTAQAVGPFVGEIIQHAAGWQWAFRAGAFGGLVAAVVATFLPGAPARASNAGDSSAGPVAAALLANGLAGFGYGSVFSFLSDYAHKVDLPAVSPFFASYVAAAVAVRLFLGHLADTFGRRAVGVPALIVHAGALLALTALTSWWQLCAIGLAFGFSHGLYYPTLQALVVERMPGAASRAIAIATFSFGLGAAIGAFTLGALAKHAGYPSIYLVSSALSLIAAGALAATRRY